MKAFSWGVKGESFLVEIYQHNPNYIIAKRAVFNQQIWYKNLLYRQNVLTDTMKQIFMYFTNVVGTTAKV